MTTARDEARKFTFPREVEILGNSVNYKYSASLLYDSAKTARTLGKSVRMTFSNGLKSFFQKAVNTKEGWCSDRQTFVGQ